MQALAKDSALPADELAALSAGCTLFRQRHDLSIRELAIVAGGGEVGISRATMERLVAGTLNPRHAARIKPSLLRSLETFLRRQGKTDAEVADELRSLTTGAYEPMFSFRCKLPADVQAHFGFRRDPFDPATSDPRSAADAFTTPQLDRIAAQIEDAINYQGFVAVVGEPGSGKTQIKKRVVEIVENSQGRMCLLFPEFFEMDKVQSGSITKYILEAFDQRPRLGLVAARRQLLDLLAGLSDQGTRVAIGFDEVHRLNDHVLTALKNFWEFGSGGYQRYLGVVLFGQPRFKERLRDSKFREIAERVDLLDMPPLAKHAWDYVSHRLRAVGADPDKVFERKAVEHLAAQASTPLALGNLCNAALVKAHSIGEARVLAAFIDRDDREPRVRAVRRAS